MNYLVKLLVVFLFLGLSGCKSLNNAPIKHLYVIDLDNGVCSKRIVTDKATLASKWVEDMPLDQCDGVIGMKAEEFLNLRSYLKGK